MTRPKGDPMLTLKQRKTPWDDEMATLPAYGGFANPAEERTSVEHSTDPSNICIHGLYIFDPRRSTSADFQQFLWAGLRLLRVEAKARGVSEEQVRQLLVSAFDLFHDTGESVWAALQSVVSKVETGVSQLGAGASFIQPRAACQEVPIPKSHALANLQQARRRRAAQTRVRRTELDEELRALDPLEV